VRNLPKRGCEISNKGFNWIAVRLDALVYVLINIFPSNNHISVLHLDKTIRDRNGQGLNIFSHNGTHLSTLNTNDDTATHAASERLFSETNVFK
jgi:hypothetical protein